ncbi:hypothetical protein [Pseudomonas sp. LB3P38]|uniref:hypothetical protein n=1 Tax=Pseudomonas lyxosi TaxID=3398358 RepID=UPI0039F14C9A
MKKVNFAVGACVFALTSSSFAALHLPDSDFEEVLNAGHWSVSVDDSAQYYSEQLPSTIIKKWVDNYKASDLESTVGLGVMVLTTSVAEWGVSSDATLPPDPHSTTHSVKWRGPVVGDDGKHLMSYAVGGIGINHTDSGELKELFDYLKTKHPNLAPKSDNFFKLRGINYDLIRANGGVCTEPRSEIKNDLDGKPFKHDKFPGGKKYCPIYKKGSTTMEDWQIFRHWMRASVREKDVQRYIIERWLNKVWLPSYNAVLAAGGTVEEAMINARIRNSSPVTAACAIKSAKGSADRIKAELEAYTSKSCGGKPGHTRRLGSIMRPVVLYHYFKAE